MRCEVSWLEESATAAWSPSRPLGIIKSRPYTIYNIKPNNQPLPGTRLPLLLNPRFIALGHPLFRCNSQNTQIFSISKGRVTVAALLVPYRAVSLVINRGEAFAAVLM